LPAFAIAAWLFYLREGTGHFLGNPEFAHYNVGFQLHPVRLGITLVRRVYYLFIANWHIIGTAAIVYAWRKSTLLRTREWGILGAVAALQT
jgi:hypothetical protein